MFTNKTDDGRNNLCGMRVTMYRKQMNKSQRELADALQLLGLDVDKNAVQRIEAVQRLGRVCHADRHPVSFGDADCGQASGGRVDSCKECCVSGFLAHKAVGDVVRIALRGSGHLLIHGGSGVFDGGGGTAVEGKPGCGRRR